MAIGHEHFWAKKKLLVEKGGVHLPEATPELFLLPLPPPPLSTLPRVPPMAAEHAAYDDML